MKTVKILLTTVALLVSFSSFSQVKIGDNPTAINAGSVLELESTNKGLLMPRISLTNTTTWGLAGTAAAGMHVYNTNTSITAGSANYPTLVSKIGEYYWDGSGWVALVPAKSCASFDVKGTVSQSIPVYGPSDIPVGVVLKPDSVAYDPTGAFNTATGEYTVPATGFYSFSISAGDDFSPADPTSLRNSTMVLRSKNRGNLTFSIFPKLFYGDGTWNSLNFMNYLQAGDKISIVYAVVHAAGPQPTTTTNVRLVKFSGTRLDCTNN